MKKKTNKTLPVVTLSREASVKKFTKFAKDLQALCAKNEVTLGETHVHIGSREFFGNSNKNFPISNLQMELMRVSCGSKELRAKFTEVSILAEADPKEECVCF